MDVAAATEYVNEELVLLKESRSEFGDGMRNLLASAGGGGARMSGVDRSIQRRIVPFSVIAAQAAPGIGADAIAVSSNPSTWSWMDLENKCHLVLGALGERERLERILGPRGPTLSMSKLHPDVWQASAPFFDHQHFKDAALNAGRAVNALIQDRLNRRDISEVRLVREAWSAEDPEPSRPRLRVKGVDRSAEPDRWNDLHLGAMQFGVGLFMRVRNVLEHSVRDEIPEELALEYIAGFSAFARWVEDAEVVEGAGSAASEA